VERDTKRARARVRACVRVVQPRARGGEVWRASSPSKPQPPGVDVVRGL